MRLDRAVPAFNQRHRAVFSGASYSLLKGDSVADKASGDWMFSPISIRRLRPPLQPLRFDANNDGRSQSDRPFTLGRNTGLGEPFYSFDARLARRFDFGDHKSLELTFEGFNLFNRTNLAGINNVVGGLLPTELLALASTRARGRRNAAPTAAARLHLGRQPAAIAVPAPLQLLGDPLVNHLIKGDSPKNAVSNF